MRRTEGAFLLVAGLLAVEPVSACTISVTAVSFGAYDTRAASADDSTGTLTALCAKNVSGPVVAIGTGGSGSFSPRTLRSGTSALSYNLYTSLARTTVWGNGSGGTATVTLTNPTAVGNDRRFTRTIYGRIPALQNVRAGSYSDTLVVTVTF